MMEKSQDQTCLYIRNEFDSPAYRISMSILFSVAALATTVLNSLVLISIWKTPSLHKPSYILIGSLALSDLLVGAIGEPMMTVNQIADLQGWENHCLIFKATRMVNYPLAAISLFTLTFISVDRLLAVKLRNRYQSVVTKKRVLLVLTACWTTMSVIPSVLLGYFGASSQNVSTLLFYAGITVMTLVVNIVICYSISFYTLRKIASSSISLSVQNEGTVQHPSSANSDIDAPKYRRSLITMFVIFIFTIVFYMPVVCVFISFSTLFGYSNTSFQTSAAYDIVLVSQGAVEFFFLLNSAINPLLYLWRIRDIREAVKTTVKTAFRIV